MESESINKQAKILTSVIGCFGMLVSFIAVSGFIPDLWLCDLASQLRLVHAIILLPCILILLILKSRKATAICVAGFVLNAIPIVGLFSKSNCTEKENSQTISILNYNSEFQFNNRYDLLQKIISERDPDIITLVEIDQIWINAIKSTTKRYPFSKILIDGPGLALFSKFPIEQSEVRHFGRSHHPRLLTTLRVNGKPIQLVVAHPPTPRSIYGYEERNNELTLIGDELKAMPMPKMLIGDLNCSPWSSAFGKLLSKGLHDSEQGFGLQPSWPARSGRVLKFLSIPPLVPIDHVLVSEDICVLNRETGPAINSDHLPVFVKVSIPK